ncbi:hypothetical protein CEUSTIGMA_g11116.t1 [Chlamydomonas eustigma]|uniref:protein-serine/threonine phosphatase n=1 Tax=Chlamydomonas eustigma TaxID=1157962 RepID=A0A250XKR8_9CHLO|nr:hypothetical protein CEUSTIGMA_g11116.t1 [Chlamydomonas eustigma]|eukprot:GAX83691.1 hypothetical protein CEUSTIGMA_g11116.t1 [Chlamydomonas eustigma]
MSSGNKRSRDNTQAHFSDTAAPASVPGRRSKGIIVSQGCKLAWGCQSVIGGRRYQENSYIAARQLPDGSKLFGVFDGHGGSHVSSFLELNVESYISTAIKLHDKQLPISWKSTFTTAFTSLDEDLRPSEPQNNDSATTTDNGGSTAVIVRLSESEIVCANCGDSRAVLSRSGEVRALSMDQNPDREDEESRIKTAGGTILHNHGARRVMGVLNMTRAIGDNWLRRFGVIPEPEVWVLDRLQYDDEFIIVASDGLWVAIDNEEAVNITRRSLRQASLKGLGSDSAARIAAKVLTRAALAKGSTDNITVIVIDLQAEITPLIIQQQIALEATGLKISSSS